MRKTRDTLYTIDLANAVQVGVGDSKAFEFKPCIELKSFNSVLKVELPTAVEGSFFFQDDKIEWIGDQKKVRIYQLPTVKVPKVQGQIGPEVTVDGVEFEIVLDRKPEEDFGLILGTSNLLHRIDGRKVIFYREIELPDPDQTRVENVVFEQEEIKVHDSRGNETIADVEIVGDFLRIIIDEDWLDKAIYPITIDPSYTVKTGVLATSLYYSCQRKLVRKSNGQLWCIYYRGSPSQIYVAYSDNEGETWTEEQVYSSSNSQSYPSLAVDGADNLHAVWQETYSDALQIRYCKRTTSWQSPEWVTGVGSNQYYPVIAVDSNNHVHVAWYGYGWGDYPGYTQIVYRKRTTSWQTIENITLVNNGQYGPSIAIDSNDYVHVVWYGYGWGSNPAYLNIQYRKRTTSWQQQESVTDKNANQSIPCIALDSSDNPHVVWHGLGWGTYSTIYQIQYRKRTTSWQAQEGVTNMGYHQDTASIAIDSNDYVHLVWYGPGWGSNPGYSNIQYRKRTDSWQPQVGITDKNVHQYMPNLISTMHPVVNGIKTNRTKEGYAFVWVDGTTIMFHKSSDLAWDSEEPIQFVNALNFGQIF